MNLSKAMETIWGSNPPYSHPVDMETLDAGFFTAMELKPEKKTEIEDAYNTLFEFDGVLPAKPHEKTAAKIEPAVPDVSNGDNPMEVVKGLSGITAELCGTWVWVSGKTWRHKKVLNSLGFKWQKEKSKWYWRPPGEKRKAGKRRMPMEYIYGKYGAQVLVANNEDE